MNSIAVFRQLRQPRHARQPRSGKALAKSATPPPPTTFLSWSNRPPPPQIVRNRWFWQYRKKWSESCQREFHRKYSLVSCGMPFFPATHPTMFKPSEKIAIVLWLFSLCFVFAFFNLQYTFCCGIYLYLWGPQIRWDSHFCNGKIMNNASALWIIAA